MAMKMKGKVPLDPKLEALREVGLQEKKQDYLPLLKEKTKCIHIGWLFDIKGRSALKDLCLSLDGSRDSYHLSGWRDLGSYLGLTSPYIRVIESRTFSGETESYYTLLAVSQLSDVTLRKVLEALEKMQRFDTIEVSHASIDYLASYILERHGQACQPNETNNEDSGYISLPSDDQRRHENEIIRPSSYIASVPLVLQKDSDVDQENIDARNGLHIFVEQNIRTLIKNVLQIMDQNVQHNPITTYASQQITCVEKTHPYTSNIVEEVVQKSHATNVNALPSDESEKKVASNKPYDCTVMLTFASDGIEYITEIAEALRRERMVGRIGVLILEEHSDKVNCNPQQFILRCFQQVNYVIPVITEGYLNSIVDTSPPIYAGLEYTDTKYTRYIYTLMNDDYIKKGCLNTKIRCLVPDHCVHLTQRHWRMREPIFETWDRVTCVEKLGTRLLNYVNRHKKKAPGQNY